MILRIAKRIFLPIALASLAWFAWESRGLLIDIVRSARPLCLGAAVLIWTLMHALSPMLSTLVFRARNFPLSYETAASIHIENLPARYVPGGIWHTVGRIAGFRSLEIGPRDISIFVFLENTLAVCVAFVIGGSLVALIRGMDGWGQIAALTVAGGAAGLLALPYILSFRRIHESNPFPRRDLAFATILTAASWCVAATAFVIYLTAFPGLPLQAGSLELAGYYLFSWGLGFIAVFAPQGIGVFEVVAADLIHDAGNFMSIAALLTGFRLVVLTADLAVWGIFSLIRANRSRTVHD